MPKTTRQPGRIGEYWLSRRYRSPVWCRTWFDNTTRQTRRASLDTCDADEAALALAAWITANVALRDADPADASCARVCGNYFERKAQGLPGADAQRVSLAMMLRHLPEGITVAELTLDLQEQLRRDLCAKGYADGTIKRGFGALKAATRWAFDNGMLTRPVPFLRLPEGPGRERVLDVSEMARLWSTPMPDHVRMFIALAIGTAARPAALLGLNRFQVDLARGTINLNPPGRTQTKKRRPVVPLADWLRPWVERVPDGPLVHWRGKPVLKIAGAFQTVRAAAGFGADVTAYTLRHSVATELARRGVPELEIALLLGHASVAHRTTGRYLHAAPEHMGRARGALDALANDIGRAGTRPMVPETVFACALRVAAGGVGTLKALKTGAGEGIRTLDPNLGKVVLYP
jgi:integrase